MNTTELQEIIAWIKTTDLMDVGFKEGKKGFSFSTCVPTAAAPYFMKSRLVPVTSPAVGIFQWNDLGKPSLAAVGDKIDAGDRLGLLDLGLKKTVPVTAPCAGRLAKICIEAGLPAQFGQPLFFIEPA